MTSHTEPAVARAGLARDTLAGSVAVVTGGGRGIGREAARACAWLGARVVVADLGSAGRETAGLIAAEGGEARFVAVDIADEGFAAALAAAAGAYGPVDILVNSAALCEVAPAADTSVALWDRTLAVNLRGPFLACRALAPAMLARGRGVIVNLVAADTVPGLAAYGASQQGLIAFTRSLAAELAVHGVRVVAMSPGIVDTPGLRDLAGKLAARLGRPEAQLFGASPHPAYAGPMPAEDAGAAVALLVADRSLGGHGELVSGYTILERAGLIAPAHSPDGLRNGAAASIAGAEYERQAQELVVQLQGVRAGDGAGRRRGAADRRDELSALHETLDELGREIEAAADDGLLLRSSQRARWVMLRESLFSLQAYYARVPEETARFTSDVGLLRRVEQSAYRRIRLIEDLIAAIERS